MSALSDDDDDAADTAKRRPWGPEEDEQLRQLVDVYGIKSWAQIATNLSNRNGKQCRERWRNHLRPQLNKGDWTTQEDCDIWDRVQDMGTKWAQISELYMPQRTDNDIKNRWNSIIRKQQHPSGREWLPEENEARATILGSASRTQVRRQGGGGVAGERKRQRVAGGGAAAGLAVGEEGGDGKKPAGRTLKVTGRAGGNPAAPRIVVPNADGGFDVSVAEEDDDDVSPIEARHKLFESPEQVHFEGRREEGDEEAEILGRDSGVRDQRRRALEALVAHGEDHVLPPSDAAEACRMLVGGEINTDTFDVDAFLPLAAATMGSLSQMNSPIGDGKMPNRPNTVGRVSGGDAPTGGNSAVVSGPGAGAHGVPTAQDWFDPELDSSLSPILTPSLRHQLRALMGSRSPTPRAQPAGTASQTPLSASGQQRDSTGSSAAFPPSRAGSTSRPSSVRLASALSAASFTLTSTLSSVANMVGDSLSASAAPKPSPTKLLSTTTTLASNASLPTTATAEA